MSHDVLVVTASTVFTFALVALALCVGLVIYNIRHNRCRGIIESGVCGRRFKHSGPCR